MQKNGITLSRGDAMSIASPAHLFLKKKKKRAGKRWPMIIGAAIQKSG